MTTPPWLPKLVNVNGDPLDVLQRLFEIFCADFLTPAPTLNGCQIWWDRRVLDPPYHEGFWHLITREDHSTGDRLLDYRRSERLPWCGPAIQNCEDDCVWVWDYREGNGRLRTYVWLERHDYVVILERQQRRGATVAFLITAFHIDGNQKRRDLERKHAARTG